MQTFKRGIVACVFMAMTVAGSAPSFAGKADKETNIKAAEPIQFGSPVEAYRKGVAAFEANRLDLALPALHAAAKEGILGAQLHLAWAYANGDKVEKNHAKAMEYFRQVTREFAGIKGKYQGVSKIAGAFVALGDYYKNGVKEINLDPDQGLAAEHYHHAASHYGDPIAQFKLAELYLAGINEAPNESAAAMWFYAASKKNHPAAQARLAELMWYGRGTTKSPVRALALLELAAQNTVDADQEWIKKLHTTLFAKADRKQVTRSKQMLAAIKTRFVMASSDENRLKPAITDETTPPPGESTPILGAAVIPVPPANNGLFQNVGTTVPTKN